ncbi:2-dehydro-3-deoxygalactonokinase [Lentilitoribacter sp. EG35]|uniref:2-dehydro-3-deoxygalactonokinase n=1 Tax=Lentilitoribacter sp. EG35 TaxID=3234192 RepID=UPI00346076FF
MLDDRKDTSLDRGEDTWIAVDWGTSNLRVWLMSYRQVVDAKTADTGMSSLEPCEFEAALLELISDWLDDHSGTRMQIVACGMVGARQGWIEAPYVQVPCNPVASKIVQPKTHNQRLDVNILSGLSQMDPPDVMRGEETQIAGFISGREDVSGILCMPGTHSKWICLNRGMVEQFTTALTGELYSLICEHSVLKTLTDKKSADADEFAKGIARAVHAPDMVLNSIFSLRARAVLQGANQIETAAFLSGLLIGSEIVSIMKNMPSGKLYLLGAGKLGELYSQALHILGHDFEKINVTELTLKGLIQARETLTKVK